MKNENHSENNGSLENCREPGKGQQPENIRKNVIWNTAGTLVYCLAQWITTVLVVHLSGYEAAGYLSLAMTTSSTFSVICLFSMRDFQVSDVRGEFAPSVYTGSRIITCSAAVVACLIASLGNASRYQIFCINAFMLIRVAEGIVDVLYGEDQKLNRYDLIGKSFVFRGLGLVASFVGGMAAFGDLLTAILLMAASSLLIAFFFDCRKTAALEELRPAPRSPEVRKLLLRCAPLVVYSFLLSAQNLTAKSELQRILGTEQLGIYASLASPTLVVQIFASVVFAPFLPGISRMIEAGRFHALRKNLRKIYGFFFLLAAVIQGGAMLLGRWGLRLLYGESILNHYELFYPIVWCTILTGCIYVLSSVLIALRQIRFLFWGMIADYLLCRLLATPCIERFGMNGASIIQILCFALFVVYSVIVCEGTVAFRGRRESVF